MAIRNGKILKPVYTSKNDDNGPNVENNTDRSWADVVRGPETNASNAATKEPAPTGDKTVTFSETCKTKDGGNPVRRSSRLQKKKLISAGERFIRKIKPKGLTAWGPFIYKIDNGGFGSWYEVI